VMRWGDGLGVRLSADEARRLGVDEGETVEVRSSRSLPEAFEPRMPPTEPLDRRRSADGLPIYTLAEMLAEARRLGPDFEPPTIDWGPDRGSEIIDDDDPR